MKRRKFLTLLPAGIACAAVAPAILAEEPQLSRETIKDLIKLMRDNSIKGPYTAYLNTGVLGRIEGFRFIESKPEDIQIWKAAKKPYYRQYERY